MEIITTHRNADFDALASVFAAKMLFPEALPVLPHGLNSNVRSFLSIHKDLFPFHNIKDLDLGQLSRLIVVDTGNWARIEGGESLAGKAGLDVFVMDHHFDRDIRANSLISGPAGATVTLILKKIRDQGLNNLSSAQATLFLCGIYEDTGNLTFPSTTAEDARTAAYLLERGADLNLVRDLLRSAYSPDQKEILFEMLQYDRRISQSGFEVSISRIDIEGHTPGLSLVVDMYHDINGADATFGVFADPKRSQTIIIGRSRPNTLDVGAIMQKLGGGGHPNAGSALLKSLAPEPAERWMAELIQGGKRRSVQIADLMSFPVMTIAPTTSMREAALLLREKGCTGLPVEESGKVVGVISRHDFRKARKASQMRSPVSAFMCSKVIHISPDCPVSQAVRLLVKHDIGRLPVIQDGRLIGIVTRSDAMRYYYDLMPE